MSESTVKKPVSVYKKDNCIQCTMTMKEMDKLGIKYETVNMSENEAEREKVKGMGYMTAPVVFVDEGNHWGGYRLEKISPLA